LLVVSHAPPAAMQRGGPQTPPMQAPLQQAALVLEQLVPSERQPAPQRPFTHAYASQH
jgi:hypothetical protein